MSFEEWWNTKDYPARCKGICKEAYEAGLHADIHTDNSNVIAELVAQIEKMKQERSVEVRQRAIKIIVSEGR